MHYYTFNIGDYASHTQHLDEFEDLAYRRMLDWCYLHESALPDSVEQIAKLIRMRTHTESIANVLQEFFILGEYGYTQHRVMRDIDKYQDKSEKAKKSAEARWNKKTTPKPVKPNANALQAQSERNANHKPITNNQEPYIEFDCFWSIYPKKVGKKEAEKAWKKATIGDDVMSLIKCHLSKAYLDTEKSFIPNPSTYINQERWNDEVILRPESETKVKLPADHQLESFAVANGLPRANGGESYFEYRRRLEGLINGGVR